MSQSEHESEFIRSNVFWDQHLRVSQIIMLRPTSTVKHPTRVSRTPLVVPSYQHVMMPTALFAACSPILACTFNITRRTGLGNLTLCSMQPATQKSRGMLGCDRRPAYIVVRVN